MKTKEDRENMTEQIKAKILRNFERHNSEMPGVTFGHLLEGIKPSEGEVVGNYPIKEFKGVFLWFNITQEVVTAINELVRDKVLLMRPCSPLLYYAGGGPVPSVPIAKPRNYKNSRWAPAIFEVGEKYT